MMLAKKYDTLQDTNNYNAYALSVIFINCQTLTLKTYNLSIILLTVRH